MPPPATPLFPLTTVLYPQGVLNLQIFEVRYLDLMKKCLRDGTPFGVVSLLDGTEVRRPEEKVQLAKIGTLVKIEQHDFVTPTLMEISTVGTQRFKLQSAAQEKNGLWMGEIQTLPADPVIEIPDHLQGAANALAELIESIGDKGISEEQLPFRKPYRLMDCGWVANRWCELLPLDKPTKLQLLALDNPLLRLELIDDTLQAQGLIGPQ
ncbi:MAG: LON peptidase substrate-binding domain-containing protein [Gammaproteobacteria bacterium]|nr:LON peptidase substrate-binding domain-containing protein [Gammaproteobacteria bacterium]MBU0849607.1 LON peptidase substrate-binding domain-containing protein [Gammaproteobacteria bacterium]MBU1266457.1 LON peptidase substrate-binding domain-containing protein [Gammaproteobacteria bacterium]MBU1530097.1 LON peptidase substrate-binding domain-containing protein [Gammaproteobacteria bacterium]MBU1779372.1 LON peptidase substrate-binding domain-containing protein [Gammaproteobacteria bacterium